MRISYRWLSEYVDAPPVEERVSVRWLSQLVDLPPVEELARRLTAVGLEVEAVERTGAQLAGVVAARIVASEKHPKADKLSVTRVDAGQGEPLQVVCGARNYQVGDVVPLAQVGATLPGGARIERATLRGVESHGMLCSARELGIDADASGLLILPRDVAPGTTATLQGRLLGLSRPTVHVTGPSGDSRTVSTSASGERFAAPVRFDAGGRWRVEVVGSGPRGPEVAALLTVRCGAAAPDDGDAAADPPDPADDRAAEARVVSAINALRERQGLPPLEPSTAVAEVARRHSAAMLSTGILAHRLPGSDGAGERLRRARVPFALVLENVAKGPTAMAAHRLAEESPAHRQNLLSRDATRIGVGIARGALPGGERIVYVTELMVEPVRSGEGDREPPRARVLEALQRARARAGAPALDSDPALDALALGAARAMLRNGEPAAMGLADAALDRGRRVAAADAFVATRPGEAARSRHVTDPRYGRVGVGVLVGDSPRFGSGLLWIAVVYTD
jgi:tRNA-binding EMAP/Myf-like protein/uncharacterized protein YkwD